MSHLSFDSLDYPDFYSVFSVSRNSSTEEIRSNYRKLALSVHPDKSSSPSDRDKFLLIQRGWEILRDESTRANYDKFLDEREKKLSIRVWSEVNFDELDEIQLRSDGDREFSFDCRCGSKYFLLESEMIEGRRIFECEGCSLAIKIIAEIEEVDENEEEKID